MFLDIERDILLSVRHVAMRNFAKSQNNLVTTCHILIYRQFIDGFKNLKVKYFQYLILVSLPLK